MERKERRRGKQERKDSKQHIRKDYSERNLRGIYQKIEEKMFKITRETENAKRDRASATVYVYSFM